MARRTPIRCPGTGAAKPVRRIDGTILCPACGCVMQSTTLAGTVRHHKRVGTTRMAQYLIGQRIAAVLDDRKA